MNGLFDELGKKIADQWLVELLPGLLWLCTALLARQLGWAHALDPRMAEPGTGKEHHGADLRPHRGRGWDYPPVGRKRSRIGCRPDEASALDLRLAFT
ncbi:MAG TPA: hypothetical protein VGS97_23775 [Actinocrinis sp.]|uniref:hypothetical protein n=1 Tax=Actinocrinis sp. TaxID=1920516 RepID=UPI002DDD61FD|nr:hypothetical protein [Actinocrinis sp.]HEV2347139.1 hypothetical protein [Actinocrinis sp.]